VNRNNLVFPPNSQTKLGRHTRSLASKRLAATAYRLSILCAVQCVAAQLFAQATEENRSWNRPVQPFRIAGNVFYVGAWEVTSFLISTPRGHILLDSGFVETVPQIRHNLNKLGFKLEDVKILLNSHAHFDHAGGLAELKRLSGARLIASTADAELLQRGGKNDFQFGDRFSYEPVVVDQKVDDGDKVELGGTTLVAHLTPGHTKGCTTWTMKTSEGGRDYQVVFVGSPSIPGYRLLNNAKYPSIISDYERTFSVLRSLPCDIFLASHGSFFGLQEKIARMKKEGTAAAFIDPEGYKKFVDEKETEFRSQLKREKAESPARLK
jgi:metallo-beta-lactamase class B